MTQEEKQLLLKDLCARQFYNTKVLGPWEKDGPCELSAIDLTSDRQVRVFEDWYKIEEVRPYLRPMSSMTEEETEEYRNLSDEVIGSYGPYHREFIAHCVRLGIKPDNPHECVDELVDMDAIDWLNAHHFDYRGLIEKGLALESPKGMYD